jgi:hypothetical protein
MKTIYSIVMLALVAFVMTAQTAHGEDVIRLQNGTMVPNTLGVGAPNSEGITLLPNGTYGAYVNGAVGSQIGPVLVRDYHNGTITANSDMSAGGTWFSPSGASVCDPFMGKGAVGREALKTGRAYIGIEKETVPFLLDREDLSV